MAPVPQEAVDRHAGQFGLLNPHPNILFSSAQKELSSLLSLSQRDSLKLMAVEQCASSVPFLLFTLSFFASPFMSLLSIFLCVRKEFF